MPRNTASASSQSCGEARRPIAWGSGRSTRIAAEALELASLAEIDEAIIGKAARRRGGADDKGRARSSAAAVVIARPNRTGRARQGMARVAGNRPDGSPGGGATSAHDHEFGIAPKRPLASRSKTGCYPPASVHREGVDMKRLIAGAVLLALGTSFAFADPSGSPAS